MAVPLDRLAKRTSPDFKSIVPKNPVNPSTSAENKLPLKEDILADLLAYLFPDMVEASMSSERKFSTDSSNSMDNDVHPFMTPREKPPQLGAAVKFPRRRTASADHKHLHVKDELDSAVEVKYVQ